MENFYRMMNNFGGLGTSSSAGTLETSVSAPPVVEESSNSTEEGTTGESTLTRPASDGALAALASEGEAIAMESLPTPHIPIAQTDDGDSDFVDAHGSSPPAEEAAVSIRAPLTGVEDESDNDDATSYGSIEERGSASVTGSSIQSPAVGEVDFAAGSLSAAQAALVRLNELAGTTPTTDRALLEGVDEEGFKTRVNEIVDNSNLSMSSQMVQNLVNELLPIVRELNGSVNSTNAEGDVSTMMNGDVANGDAGRPVAKLTGDEEDEAAEADEEDEVAEADEEDDHFVVEEDELEEGEEDEEDDEGAGTVAETGEGLRVRADREGMEDDDDDEDEWDDEDSDPIAALQNAVRASAAAAADEAGPAAGQPSQPQGLGTGQPLTGAARREGGSAPRSTAAPPAGPSPAAAAAEEDPEQRKIREKMMSLRVKLLRVATRLGQDHHNPVVAQVLYRLRLVEQMRSSGRVGGVVGPSVDDAVRAAAQLEESEGSDSDLDFGCTIMLLGKSGVGKSEIVNTLFNTGRRVSAFQPATTKVTESVTTIKGIKIRVIDTPGLLPAVTDQKKNEKILGQVKKFIKNRDPEIMLYVDRLDVQPPPYGDLPLLRTVTEVFGPAVWFNAMVVFTHAATSPPDDQRGNPLNYETYQAQRSYTVQQSIRQAAGDMRLMNPVALAENHPNCRTNRAGERVLPNGQIWRPQLLLLCFSSKILNEANSLWRPQDAAGGLLRMGGGAGQRARNNTLPYLLSQLLQWHEPLRLPDDQMGAEEDELEEIFGDEIDERDDEEEDLPPFNPLSSQQLAQLKPQQRREYFEELEEREKIFRRKEFRENIRRRREMKRRAAAFKEGLTTEETTAMEEEEEAQRNAAVPVAMPDLLLPPSFDSDNPVYRYRALETGTWLVRPLLEQHGWDHDAGYDAFSIEKSFVIAGMPGTVNGQISKDKKDAQIALEAAMSKWFGEAGPFTPVSTTGLDVHTIGKDLAYTLHAGHRISNLKRNKTSAGFSLTLLGEAITFGLKLEDRLSLGKRGKITAAVGQLKGRNDSARGGNLELTVHHSKDYPLDRSQTVLGATVMDWQGDLALGANVQTSFSLGKTSLTCRSNLNNRGAGQISIRAHSNEQMYMALVGVVPLVQHFIGMRLLGRHGQN